MDMATLVLIRHAKAVPHRPADKGRELADRGREQCARVREWLTERQVAPDRVVVSSATRTRETWELCSVGTVPPEYDDRVYGADVADLREVIEQTPAQVSTLVLVGHNPTFEDLAYELDDSAPARDRTNQGMPTAGVAIFELDSWQAPRGRLTAWLGR